MRVTTLQGSKLRVLCSLLIAVLFIFVGCEISQKLSSSEDIESKSGHFNSSSFYDRMVTYHQQQDSSLPKCTTVFIGDSIVQGLATSAVSPISVNYGIGSDTTAGVLRRLPKYKSLSSAKAIVLSIGVNDLLTQSATHILSNYGKILSSIPEDRPVLVVAILPVDELSFKKASVSNKRISMVNDSLSRLAGEYEKATFINLRGLLEDEHGNLSERFHAGDGVHLTSIGYEFLIAEIRNGLKDVHCY